MVGESAHSLDDKSVILRVINGLEAGTLGAADSYNILKDRDPILVYFALRYVKEKFSSDHPQAKAVYERLLELTSTYDEMKKMLRTGEKDPMREWFDDSYSIRDYQRDPEGYIDLIIDKLES